MNSYYLNYKIISNYLDTIDEKYKNQIDINKNTIFLYSNILEISKFYNLSHPIYKNLSIINCYKKSPKILFESLINYTKTYSYNKKDITLLYSLSLYYVIDKSKKLDNITFSYDYNLFISDTKLKKYFKYFNESNVYDPYILSTFNDIINKTYNIYNADLILDRGLNNFKKYVNRNIFLKLKYYLFFFSKNYKEIDVYKKNKDNTNNSIEFDFRDEFNQVLDAINDYLYLNKKNKFDNYFGR